jgi:haloalkane dehalogenase/tRNA(adenine34) deaminase
MSSDVLRTPEHCFEGIPGYPWKARHVDDLPGFAGMRMAYLDEGPTDAPVFLCLHGEPTWSYLYRKMIPVFLAAGLRVVAPDFFGFGRSDKPVAEGVYTFDFHRAALRALLERLALRRFTLVCQDWGGLIGLTLPVADPGCIERLLVMNTALAVGVAPSPGFLAWRDFVRNRPDFDLASFMRRAVPDLSEEEARAYAAPFPDARFRAGVRRFPELVPVTPDMPGAALSREAAAWWRTAWSGPTFMAVGLADPVLGRTPMAWLRSQLRGCPPALELATAGHFVPEHGAQVARAALAAFGLERREATA